MAIYIFSLLVGYVPNGVDNAQGYRARMLKKYTNSVKYIFTELPTRRYVNRYRKAGIDVEQMLSIHQYFTDNHSLSLSVRVEDKLAELKESLQYTDTSREGTEIRLFRKGSVIASLLTDEMEPGCCHSIQYYNGGRLIREEHYTTGIAYVDYYVTAESDTGPYAKLVRRSFYDSDGEVSFDQVFAMEKELYLFPDGRACTKSEFIAEFIKRLNLGEGDTVLLDRSAQFDFVQPLFAYGNRARFIAVFHSGHFFEKGEDIHTLYLNYEYYYWFKYSGMVETMVVSTEGQKRELLEKLQEYGCSIPKIVVIPAGGIDRLRYPDTGRKPYSLISVSRMDPRKKIEWIIKSVIKAYKRNANISLDLYGRGEYEYTKYLQDLVEKNNAQTYIRFKGRADVTEIYKNYEVYVSASLWETLGLSIMEAIGSGMALIGLNVKYGNQVFIHPEENGYLVDYDPKHSQEKEDELIECMADSIVEIFKDSERLERFHQFSYETGREFFWSVIEEKWKKLLL